MKETTNIESNDGIHNKIAFLWVAIVSGLVLLIPLISMQFTSEVNWKLNDFIIMGILLLSTGSLFVLISRRVARKYHLPIGALLLVLFLYLWAELAVGIFIGLGS